MKKVKKVEVNIIKQVVGEDAVSKENMYLGKHLDKLTEWMINTYNEFYDSVPMDTRMHMDEQMDEHRGKSKNQTSETDLELRWLKAENEAAQKRVTQLGHEVMDLKGQNNELKGLPRGLKRFPRGTNNVV